MAEVRLPALPALGTAHSVGPASIGCKARICGRLAPVMCIIACASAALSPDCTSRKGVSSHRVAYHECAAWQSPCATYVCALLRDLDDLSWLSLSRVRWEGLQLSPDCTSRKGVSSHRVACHQCVAWQSPCAASVCALLRDLDALSWFSVSRVRWVDLQHVHWHTLQAPTVNNSFVQLSWAVSCAQTPDYGDLFDDVDLTTLHESKVQVLAAFIVEGPKEPPGVLRPDARDGWWRAAVTTALGTCAHKLLHVHADSICVNGRVGETGEVESLFPIGRVALLEGVSLQAVLGSVSHIKVVVDVPGSSPLKKMTMVLCPRDSIEDTPYFKERHWSEGVSDGFARNLLYVTIPWEVDVKSDQQRAALWLGKNEKWIIKQLQADQRYQDATIEYSRLLWDAAGNHTQVLFGVAAPGGFGVLPGELQVVVGVAGTREAPKPVFKVKEVSWAVMGPRHRCAAPVVERVGPGTSRQGLGAAGCYSCNSYERAALQVLPQRQVRAHGRARGEQGMPGQEQRGRPQQVCASASPPGAGRRRRQGAARRAACGAACTPVAAHCPNWRRSSQACRGRRLPSSPAAAARGSPPS